MSTRVDELIKAIDTLSDTERAELLARVQPTPDQSAFVPVDELRQQHDGQWVALELPEGEDNYNPKFARLIASGETGEDACEAARTTGYKSVTHFYYFGCRRGRLGPLGYLGENDEIQVAEPQP